MYVPTFACPFFREAKVSMSNAFDYFGILKIAATNAKLSIAFRYRINNLKSYC